MRLWPAVATLRCEFCGFASPNPSLNFELPKPFHGFRGHFGITKAGQAEVTLPAGAETSAGSTNHIGAFQQRVKELPGVQAVR